MTTYGITTSKKCERLATAIYLVTNFLSDTEPMKARLRTLSLDFVRDASLVRNGSQMIETSVLESLRANIQETLALLELAFVAGLVSEMNFTILKREYSSLRGTIDVKKASRESRTDNILGDNFFGTPEPLYSSSSSLRGGTTKQSNTTTLDQRPVDFHKGHSVGQTNVVVSDKNQNTQKVATTIVAQNVASKTAHGHDSKLSMSVRATTDVAKESRRARILKLVKDNHEVSIKDIVAHFPDLSEKTIQRELVSMSDSGVLKKSGERRWSRYTLA